MLQHRPLVVVCAGFIAGILIAVNLGGGMAAYAIAAVCAIVWLAADGKRALIAAALAALAVGGLRTVLVTTRAANDISLAAPARAVRISGVVDGEPSTHNSSVQFTLDCDRISLDGSDRKVSGKLAVIAAVSDREAMPPLHDGDRETFTASLERPRPASNPGGFSWADSLAHRGIWAEAYVKSRAAFEDQRTGSGGSTTFTRLGWLAREQLLAGLSRTISQRDYGVLSGVLFGIRSDIPPPVMAAFIATGTVHILATAGLHIGVITLLLRWGGYLIGLPRKWAASGSIALLWLYDIMAGGRPAVTRAVIVATIYLAATVFERAPEVLTSVAAAALVILFAQPTVLLEPGFQMSFLTVLTLAALLPIWQYALEPMREKLHYKSRRAAGVVIDLVGMCLVAQIGAAPIVASEFHIVPVCSFAANLLVVPLVFVLIPTGLLVALLSPGLPHVAAGFASVTVHPMISAILWATRLFGGGPASSAAVADVPGWFLLVYYVCVCGGGFVWQQKMAANRRRALHDSAVDPGAVDTVVRTA